MSMSDPVADMLCRIRNALGARHEKVSCPSSNQKVAIARILKQEGYIEDFSIKKEDSKKDLWITLRYHQEAPVIHKIVKVSKPSRRHYIKLTDIKPVKNNIGIMILSTSHGIITGKEAKKIQTGGELICKIW